MINHTKLAFGRTINDHSQNMPKGRGDCFDYGILSGCDYGCPALWEGECPEPDEVVGKLSYDINKVELKELVEIYRGKEE